MLSKTCSIQLFEYIVFISLTPGFMHLGRNLKYEFLRAMTTNYNENILT